MKKFQFTGISRITLIHSDGMLTSKLHSTDLRLELSNNLDNRKYLDKGIPTQNAIKPLTQCFIQGLVANIQAAHDHGYWDSAEHLRYIISELERGFIEVKDIQVSTW
jgi:hypothetical protein